MSFSLAAYPVHAYKCVCVYVYVSTPSFSLSQLCGLKCHHDGININSEPGDGFPLAVKDASDMHMHTRLWIYGVCDSLNQKESHSSLPHRYEKKEVKWRAHIIIRACLRRHANTGKAAETNHYSLSKDPYVQKKSLVCYWVNLLFYSSSGLAFYGWIRV